MEKIYDDSTNIQILIALLKKYGIKKIIASPGGTNTSFVGSIQNDSFFEIYSSVDERSAAYMACGLSEESGEPVVISCTGATASRNYMPGLTEAYYRKIPILSITSSQESSRIGHLSPQLTDRTLMPKDVVKHSVELSLVKDQIDFWSNEIKCNQALLELNRHGGGPVHINLVSKFRQKIDTSKLPNVRLINRINSKSIFPELKFRRIGIFIGSHKNISLELTNLIDDFCEKNNAAVFCDHTSGYNGKYKILFSLISSQRYTEMKNLKPDLTIHIGEISGDYYIEKLIGDSVWRINEDGEIRDTFFKLENIFEIDEMSFFKQYTKRNNIKNLDYYTEIKNVLDELRKKIPKIPFSNIWIANYLHNLIPSNSILHFAILNSLRSWNFFEINNSIKTSSNVGGFGIDGCTSTLIGASLYEEKKLYYLITGDLAFFYDLNVLGNRELKNNVRILLINNGIGTEFKNFDNSVSNFGKDTDKFIAAKGHFGNKSPILVKDLAFALDFEYITANGIKEFEENHSLFIDPKYNKSIIFEVFTNDYEENKALEIITSLEISKKELAKTKVKKIIKDMIKT